jgi:hypothetical protein
LDKRPLSGISYLDGLRYQRAILSGCSKILLYEKELNRINVFPIPDQDTGTNLKKTLMPVINTFPFQQPDIHIISKKISHTAVHSALGYSGIIFAQILRGFAEGLKNFQKIQTKDLGRISDMAVQKAYQSLEQPAEGTILSVVKAWSDEINRICSSTDDFTPLLYKSYQKALLALQQTPRQLEILRKHRVVDAGGKAFVLFLEGMIEYTEKGNVKLFPFKKEDATIQTAEAQQKAPLCAECCVRGKKLDRVKLINKLNQHGQDLIFFGSSEFAKIHINTPVPEEIFITAAQFGEVSSKKIYKYSDTLSAQSTASCCFVVDSTCDISDDFIESSDVYFVPIKVHIDETIYTDRWEIIPEEFYGIWESSSGLPKTSQPSLMDFTRIFRHLLVHYQNIISLHISKELSGTFQTAVQAANSVSSKRITVLDGKNISVGSGLILLEGIEALKEGKKASQAADRLKKAADAVVIYIGLPTLKYLVKGGRITKAKGLIAKILNINPILSINAQGKLVPIGKARGEKNLREKIIHLAVKEAEDRTKGFSAAVAHTDAYQVADSISRRITEMTGQEVKMVMNASPALGAHAGPGVFGIAFFKADYLSSFGSGTQKT